MTPPEAEALIVRVPTESSRYRVEVSPGALDRLGEVCRARAPAHRYAVISDGTVASLYGERALDALRATGVGADLFTFPAGEGSKTRGRWSRLTDSLLEAGHGRDSVVVALGGGVTGDLAGFVAATFMRGVPVVQVPTTLLAMVDSSVGGKVGVDTAHGKNPVGAFHHPAHVLVDPRVLETLPGPRLREGLAEAVKAAAIADPDFFRWLEERAERAADGDVETLARLVRRAVSIKARVVEEDPGETGLRAILNFGHTVGHALEAASGYELVHGRAVAAGMRVEARVGEDRGVTEAGTSDRLAALLDACGLRDRPESEADPGDLLHAMDADKKKRRGRIRLVLLEKIGQVARGPDGRYTHRLSPDEGSAGAEADGAGLAAALRGRQPGPDSSDDFAEEQSGPGR